MFLRKGLPHNCYCYVISFVFGVRSRLWPAVVVFLIYECTCVLHVGGEERGGGKVSGSVGGVERLDGVEIEGGSSVWGGGCTLEEEGEGEET